MNSQAQLKNYADCGVYSISHIESGKVYVGSSVGIRQRIAIHKWNLKRKSHPNQSLQNAYNKYGVDCFLFKKIIACPPEDILFHEQRIMDDKQSYVKGFGYN